MINIMSVYELLNNRISPRLSRGKGRNQREKGERDIERWGESSRHKYARARVYAMEGLMKD